MGFPKFPKEKDETDYLLTFNREVKEWRKAMRGELGKRLEKLRRDVRDSERFREMKVIMEFLEALR